MVVYIKVFLGTQYLEGKKEKLQKRPGMPEDSSEFWFLVASYPVKTILGEKKYLAPCGSANWTDHLPVSSTLLGQAL